MVVVAMAFGAFIGALLGAVGVIFFDVSLLAGVGIYLVTTMVMVVGAFLVALRQDSAATASEPDALRNDLA